MRVLVRFWVALAAAWLVPITAAVGQLGPEQPASLVLYPLVVADTSAGRDTILQLSNASDAAVDVRCLYENVNGHCDDSGNVCVTDEDCGPDESCEPGFAVTTFDLRLTPRQPIGWRASTGLDALPLPGNEGAVPPLPELPFRGALRCFATDDSAVPAGADVLVGLATVESFVAGPEERLDVAKYVALGARVDGTLADDGRLVLGGFDEPEYEGCANTLSFQSAFTPAFDPTQSREIETTLVLLSCSAFYGDGRPGEAEVSYMIINEFGERRTRATPIRVAGLFAATLDEIDPLLFTRAAQGTAAGRTQLTGFGSGVVGLLIETHRDLGDPTLVHSAARGLYQQGQRSTSDVLSFVETSGCAGDCNADARVDVAEVVNAVSISLGASLALCNAADTGGDGAVDVTELIAAVNNLLGGCP